MPLEHPRYNSVKTGRLLISEPFMMDPNFKRSAVMLADHRADGTVGFVLNRPIGMKIDQLVADFPEFDSDVFFGGPVATDTIHYIHCVGDLLDDSIRVMQGVYWGGDFNKLKFLIQSGLIEPKHIRFFIGYAGWDPGQLKDELAVGSWYITRMHANYLFKSAPASLWKQINHNMGENHSVIAQMPDPVCLN